MYFFLAFPLIIQVNIYYTKFNAVRRARPIQVYNTRGKFLVHSQTIVQNFTLGTHYPFSVTIINIMQCVEYEN